MKCCKCGVEPNDHGPAGWIPIDGKGVKNRRWVCTDCATPEQMRSLDEVSKHLLRTLGGIEVPE